MNNFITRSLTGFIFAITIVGSAVLGQTVFAYLLLILTVLCVNEFVAIVANETVKPALWPTVIVGGVVYSAFAANAIGIIGPQVFLAILPAIFLVFVIELWRKKTNPFTNIAFSLLGIFYIAVPFGLLMYFFDPINTKGPEHYGIVLGFLFILWLNDTGAYLIGSMLGKHKLFERISPGKTWEGSFGGAFFAMIVAGVLSLVFKQLNLVQWMFFSLIIVTFGTLGDLIESMLKRSLGIKDSGNILPGHGGLLDRFDAVLLSVPFVFVYLALFCR